MALGLGTPIPDNAALSRVPRGYGGGCVPCRIGSVTVFDGARLVLVSASTTMTAMVMSTVNVVMVATSRCEGSLTVFVDSIVECLALPDMVDRH